MAIPVYVFLGFLESGKTTLIKTTLQDDGFNEGEHTLLFVCESGLEEYDSKLLKETHTDLVVVNDFSEITADFLRECDKKYHPQRVMFEYNGTWDIDDLLSIQTPIDWIYVQMLTTIDASTFVSYINNMRTFMFNAIKPADVVVINRCSDDMKKSYLRSNVKSINKGAQIIYEMEDGTINSMTDDEMPFDLNADIIEISDDDYGLWYMDALDNPQKYEGKTVRYKGKVMHQAGIPDNAFAFGREAMVCCSEDTQLIGLFVQSKNAEAMIQDDWIILTAYVSCVYDKEYHGEVPFLTELEYKRVPPIENDMVYFS